MFGLFWGTSSFCLFQRMENFTGACSVWSVSEVCQEIFSAASAQDCRLSCGHSSCFITYMCWQLPQTVTHILNHSALIWPINCSSLPEALELKHPFHFTIDGKVIGETAFNLIFFILTFLSFTLSKIRRDLYFTIQFIFSSTLTLFSTNSVSNASLLLRLFSFFHESLLKALFFFMTANSYLHNVGKV